MRTLVAALAFVLAAPVPVAAQPVSVDNLEFRLPLTDDELELALQIGRGTVNRARRAVAFGPEVGASAAISAEGDVEVPISVGLGLVLFKVPVLPSLDVVRDVIRARVKALLVERVKTLVAGGQPMPSQDELDRMARDIYEGIKAEILGTHARRSTRFERPRVGAHLEGAYWPRSGDGEGRLTAVFGLGRIAIGPSLAVHGGNGAGLSLGAELDFHVMLSPGPRSHPLIVYLRGEYGATSAVEGNDLVVLGARLMLDLI